MRTTQTWLSWCLVLFVFASLLACEDEPVNVPSTTTTPCNTSADCDRVEETEGHLCVEGVCVACLSDPACSEDSYYEQGAVCMSNQCRPCVAGTVDCPCDDGDTCADGVCRDDVCVLCPEASEGCACGDSDACNAGLRCENERCVSCPEASEGCVCLDNGACNRGLRCEEEVCVECPVGSEDCPCVNDSICNGDLVCQGGICAESSCVPGTEECPCEEGDTCEDDLVCGDDGMCRECIAGMEGCPCEEDDVCDGDLVCDAQDEVCRDALACDDVDCVENQLCEEGEDDEDALCLESCVAGFVWNAQAQACEPMEAANCQEGDPQSLLEICQAQMRACVEEGSSARCGDCFEGTTDEEGALDTCRAFLGCDVLDCAAQNRNCDMGEDDEDARCDACLIGFAEENGTCEPVVSNCTPGDPDSIFEDCESQNRTCEAAAESAMCGGCLDGYSEDPESGLCAMCDEDACGLLNRSCSGSVGGACGDCLPGTSSETPNDPASVCAEDRLTCEDFQTRCEEMGLEEFCCANRGLFCQEGEGGEGASCETRPCPEGEAFDSISGTCLLCTRSCDQEGLTGELWPISSALGCVCETEPGFYYEIGEATGARPCDRDGDGWLRSSVRSALSGDDEALLSNARCDLRGIDRFVLRNEVGQELELLSCEGDNPIVPASEGCPEGVRPIYLYESDRNDDVELLELRGVDVPAYVADNNGSPQGRRFRPEELNPLTRACVTTGADYNDNGRSDAHEHHAIGTELSGEFAAFAPFAAFGYFMELHRGWYETGVEANSCGNGIACGRYVIAERSRCDADFPIQYDAGESAYAKGCTRNRDVLFNPDPSVFTPIGFDFAQWSCDDLNGSCPTPPPAIDTTQSFASIPDHGLCLPNGTTRPVTDGIWRGMNHHSQFKCSVISSTIDNPNREPHVLLSNDLAGSINPTGDYQFNTCRIACPEGDLDCTNDCNENGCQVSLEPGQVSSPDDESNPSSPVFVCDPTDQDGTIEAGAVGFTAVRFLDFSFREELSVYTRGCIDEWNASPTAAEYVPWRSLCPGYSEELDRLGVIKGLGDTGNFGAIVCGCNRFFGGVGCDQGCPNSMVGGPASNDFAGCTNGYCPVAPAGGDGGRLGYWMCGQFSVTSHTAPNSPPLFFEAGTNGQSGGWTIKGNIPSNTVTSGERLCDPRDPQNCSAGYRVLHGAPCQRGAQGCGCTLEGTCNEGLVCNAGRQCEQP